MRAILLTCGLGLLALGLLSACGAGRVTGDPSPHAAQGIGAPTPARFAYCSMHGCKQQTVVSLPPASWAQVAALFQPPPATPAIERERVAEAAGLFERLVGPLAGTSGDLPLTFAGAFGKGQLDCVDESVNTTTFIVMLHDAGLLAWHRPAAPAKRGSFIDEWPHRTAVMADNASGVEYAVDSWFRANGEPAFVVTLAEWLNRASPNRPRELWALDGAASAGAAVNQ